MIYQFFKIDHYRNDFIPLLPTKLPPLTRGFGVNRASFHLTRNLPRLRSSPSPIRRNFSQFGDRFIAPSTSLSVIDLLLIFIT
jgi:hypothetical protein